MEVRKGDDEMMHILADFRNTMGALEFLACSYRRLRQMNKTDEHCIIKSIDQIKLSLSRLPEQRDQKKPSQFANLIAPTLPNASNIP